MSFLTNTMQPRNPLYTEIFKLEDMLSAANIPHTMERMFDGWIVKMYDIHGELIADAIQHYGSYGCRENLLEESGMMDDYDVTGCVTAEEVFKAWVVRVE